MRIENTGMRPQTSESLQVNAQCQSYHIQPAFVSEDGLSKTPISRTTLLFPTFEGCTWSSIRIVFLNELSQSLSNLATSLSLGPSSSRIWPSMMPSLCPEHSSFPDTSVPLASSHLSSETQKTCHPSGKPSQLPPQSELLDFSTSCYIKASL